MRPLLTSFPLLLVSGLPAFAALGPLPSHLKPAVIVSTEAEPVAAGKFQPSWESLSQYEVPEWVRDRKFGIWAHWGPNASPRPATGMPATCMCKATGNTKPTWRNTATPPNSASRT